MKLILSLSVLLLSITLTANAQIFYSYDAAGNRIKAYTIEEEKNETKINDRTFNDSLIRNNVRIYPNPTVNTLIISPKNEVLYTCKIYDIQGKLMIERVAQTVLEISLSEFKQGTYFVEVEYNGNKASWKVIKN
jgi:hypothetical protein